MAKFKAVSLAIIAISFWLFSLGDTYASEKPAFVTIVNPIRSRQFWQDISLFDKHIEILAGFNLPATWLLQYDILLDREVTSRLKKLPQDEIGVFLEVSENLATDSETPYLIGEGDWARADKVFFSGYEREERKMMVDKLFEKFKKTFGFYPKSVGAWYIDPVTLTYVVEKYKVTAAIDCADQYSTDAYQIWGKPWGVPYYPSRFNTLVPAQTQKNKLSVVKIQWALRDPKLGFGRTTFASTYSLQANDYQRYHRLGIDYFEKILDVYLKTDNQFSQATVGLEVGQEVAFLPEFARQTEAVAKRKNKQEVDVLTLSQFAAWYKEKFPSISPEHVISLDDTSWYSSPWKRIGKDSRLYDEGFLEKDLVFADKRKALYRVVGEKTSFTGARKWKKLISLIALKINNLPLPVYHLPPLRFSNIGKTNVVGIQIDKTKLLGLKYSPFSFGIFEYPFQTLVRFRTWPKLNILARFFVSDSQLQLEEFLATYKGKNYLILKREEIDVPMMEEFEKNGQKLVLENSEFQVWERK